MTSVQSPMQGTRLETLREFYDRRVPGSYVKVRSQENDGHDGDVWYIIDPFGAVGALRKHTVTEHDDGTITVEPSIAPRDGAPPGSFHGWLRAGVWTW